MKYQCASCEEIFDDDKVIMVGVVSGWNFYTSTIFCNDCFKLYQNSKKVCYECRYYKNKRKNEPCRSCKNHSNWEKTL